MKRCSGSNLWSRIILKHEIKHDFSENMKTIHSLVAELRNSRKNAPCPSLGRLRRWTSATRCVTHIVLYTEVDAKCDNLASVVGRTNFTTVHGSRRNFSVQSFEQSSREKYPHFGGTRISLQHRNRKSLYAKNSSICQAVLLQYCLVRDRQTHRHGAIINTAVG